MNAYETGKAHGFTVVIAYPQMELENFKELAKIHAVGNYSQKKAQEQYTAGFVSNHKSQRITPIEEFEVFTF